MPDEIHAAVEKAYTELGDDDGLPPVAVRSSATAEDTASASFAGMNETFLNVHSPSGVVDAVRRCWASLFGARTIFYRAKRGLDQAGMDIAVVVQRQIPSTRAGVMFTADPATGELDHLVIEGAFGLGESVVSGSVSPDRYVVDKDGRRMLKREIRHKELVVEGVAAAGGTIVRDAREDEAEAPTLSDDEVAELAELGCAIEEHYGAPQDTEWAYAPDGQGLDAPVAADHDARGRPGRAGRPTPTAACWCAASGRRRAGPRAASGCSSTLTEGGDLADGDVLVAHMTTPDWVPLMRRAAAIVTDSGGMTCHAAIVSRELGVPCLVGTGAATTTLRDEEVVTVDAGKGVVTEGARAAEPAVAAGAAPTGPAAPPVTATRLLVNLSEPSQVDRAAALPVDGVGLLRAELMILEALGGRAPPAAARGGARRGVRGPHGRGADDVRRRLLPAAGHLPHDRLPHERVPRPRGRRATSSPRRRTR